MQESLNTGFPLFLRRHKSFIFTHGRKGKGGQCFRKTEIALFLLRRWRRPRNRRKRRAKWRRCTLQDIQTHNGFPAPKMAQKEPSLFVCAIDRERGGGNFFVPKKPTNGKCISGWIFGETIVPLPTNKTFLINPLCCAAW